MDHEFGFNSNIILGPRDANLPDCSIQHYLYKQLQSHDKNKTLYVSTLLVTFFSSNESVFFSTMLNVIYP